MPILFATSPFAAMRSAPTTTRSTSPAAISEPAAESAITLYGISNCSSSQAVSRAPWSSGRVSFTHTCPTSAARSTPERRAVAAGGERPGVAVGERAVAGLEALRAQLRQRPVGVELLALQRPRGLQRVVRRQPPPQRPRQVGGRGAGGAQHPRRLVEVDRSPPPRSARRRPRRARGRTRPPGRSRALPAPPSRRSRRPPPPGDVHRIHSSDAGSRRWSSTSSAPSSYLSGALTSSPCPGRP